MNMTKSILLREANKNDQCFLFEMLYQSIFVEIDAPKPDRQIIKKPSISKYVEDWGNTGDHAIIATDKNGNNLGAVWLRYFNANNKGYGYISDDIPEIGIAVDEMYRGKGIGSALLKQILKIKKEIKSISLSVHENNPAINLYKSFDFYEYSKSGDSLIMRYDKKIINKRLFLHHNSPSL